MDCIYIGSFGIDKALVGIWLAGLLVRNEKLIARKLIHINQIELDFTRHLPSLLSSRSAYLSSYLQLYAGNIDLVYLDRPNILGRLGTPAKVSNDRWMTKAIALAKSAYSLELQHLMASRPEYPLAKLNHAYPFLPQTIFDLGPILGMRRSYLRRLPHTWLWLLQEADYSTIESNWHLYPPRWWRQMFAVPWWHWYSKHEFSTMSILLTKYGKRQCGDDWLKKAYKITAKGELLDG